MHPRSRRRSLLAASLAAATVGAVLLPQSASARARRPVPPSLPPAAAAAASTTGPNLPSPPRPPAGRPRVAAPATGGGTARAPRQRTALSATTATTTTATATTTTATATTATATTFGRTGTGTQTLVLYDTTGPFGWLGELYALAGGTLATHFGEVTAEPVAEYTAGQLDGFDAAVYIGSTYNEAIPAALIADVTTSTTPVIWSGFNVWQLAGASGSTTAAAFRARYG